MELTVKRLQKTPTLLICHNVDGVIVYVDPFVTCAWEPEEEGQFSVGKKIILDDDTYQHPGGEFLPDRSEIKFKKPNVRI